MIDVGRTRTCAFSVLLWGFQGKPRWIFLFGGDKLPFVTNVFWFSSEVPELLLSNNKFLLIVREGAKLTPRTPWPASGRRGRQRCTRYSSPLARWRTACDTRSGGPPWAPSRWNTRRWSDWRHTEPDRTHSGNCPCSSCVCVCWKKRQTFIFDFFLPLFHNISLSSTVRLCLFIFLSHPYGHIDTYIHMYI